MRRREEGGGETAWEEQKETEGGGEGGGGGREGGEAFPPSPSPRPSLQMIVMGLIGGMKSIGYIVLLLFLVFYM